MSPGGVTVSDARPFPGLRPYEYKDRDYFFGREDQSFALFRLIDLGGFVAVIGSSGSGKSSLVLAGLLPLLKKERDEGGRDWRWEIMRPGDDPLGGLAELLTSLAKDKDADVRKQRRERIEYRIRRSSFGMADALREIDGFDKGKLVLVVDQFEEVFRLAAGAPGFSPIEAERARNAAAMFVQILLEADRDPKVNVRVLITMRSDFIGDCARFHGLPEAVSGCQFLVPALTRDQLEATIVKPIERAKAKIAPELVRRLVNDSGDDMDLLPVLQHALSRLWQCAGDRQGATSGPPEIELEDYETIGTLAHALSNHANEILRTLPEPSVERVFRALSDVDKERRVIRRSLPFEQLAAETGIDTGALSDVLAPFRADDCSFLLPSVSKRAALEPGTIVSVGHEALLRRWEKVSGDAKMPERERRGWWRDEGADGQAYRFLLYRLDNGEKTLPFDAVERNATWWRARVRTQAWAERHGGRRDEVERFILDSQAAVAAETARREAERLRVEQDRERKRVEEARKLAKEKRDERRRRSSIIVVAAMLIAAGSWLYLSSQWRAVDLANQRVQLVTASTQKFLEQVNKSFDRGDVGLKGASDLMGIAIDSVNALGDKDLGDDAKSVRVNYLFVVSDLASHLQQYAKAMLRANEAEKLAEKLAAADPKNSQWLHLVSASALRVGNARAHQGYDKANVDLVFSDYGTALDSGEAAAAIYPAYHEAQLDMAWAHARRGEWKTITHDAPGATAEFEASLEIMKRLIATRADPPPEWRAEFASAEQRVGRDRMRRDKSDGPVALLKSAFDIHGQLLADDPTNTVYLFNLTSSHTDMANIAEAKGLWADSIKEHVTVIGMAVDMVNRDPGNLFWKSLLAQDYDSAAEALARRDKVLGVGDAERADNDKLIVEYYQKALEIRDEAAARDPGDAQARRGVAALSERLGDMEVRQAQWDLALALYRKADDAWDAITRVNPACSDCATHEARVGAKLGDALLERP